ncbi:MAG: hypothetical protein E7438_00725 [Ruminococcaceae bacterium]|nr:hypothetical protein [Oscillospiraceae bacterium]
MRKFISKKSIVLVALALLLTVAVGTTLAYIFTNTDPVENTFKPSKVSCAVVETFEKNVKSNVKIQNTGDTDAYIRVAVVITWKYTDSNGIEHVWAEKPVERTDYSITYPSDTGWVEGADGYYYYTQKVAPDATTGILISSASPITTGPKGTDNTQYYLSIEIVASAIQADGMGATSAQEAWAKAKTQGSNQGG